MQSIRPASPTDKDSRNSSPPDSQLFSIVISEAEPPALLTEENKNITTFTSTSKASTSATDTPANKPALVTPTTAGSEVATITPFPAENEVLLSPEPNITPFLFPSIQNEVDKKEKNEGNCSPPLRHCERKRSNPGFSELLRTTHAHEVALESLDCFASARNDGTGRVVTNEEKKKEGKLVFSLPITINNNVQFVESGKGWVTAIKFMQENKLLRLQKEVLKKQVARAEHQTNHWAGIATQLSNQLSNLLSFFGYPYYAPYPSAMMIHQPSAVPSPFLPQSDVHESNPFTRR